MTDLREKIEDLIRNRGLNGRDGDLATEILALLPQPAVPEGWVMVPKEPTPAMLNGGWMDKNDYARLLAASPSPPKETP